MLNCNSENETELVSGRILYCEITEHKTYTFIQLKKWDENISCKHIYQFLTMNTDNKTCKQPKIVSLLHEQFKKPG
jgi:hypothetical protein